MGQKIERVVIDALALNETLADGLAKRFKNVVATHTEAAKKTIARGRLPSQFEEVYADLVDEATRVTSKKKAITSIKRGFARLYFAREWVELLWDGKKLHSIELDGFCLSDGLVRTSNALIHLRKPQESIGGDHFVGFTTHSISRILLRMKPTRLDDVLPHIAKLLTGALLNKGGNHYQPLKDEAPVWLYVKHVGGFLLQGSGSRVSVITYVSCEKFRHDQSSLGERELIELVSPSSSVALMVEDLVREIVKNKIGGKVSVPLVGYDCVS